MWRWMKGVEGVEMVQRSTFLAMDVWTGLPAGTRGVTTFQTFVVVLVYVTPIMSFMSLLTDKESFSQK